MAAFQGPPNDIYQPLYERNANNSMVIKSKLFSPNPNFLRYYYIRNDALHRSEPLSQDFLNALRQVIPQNPLMVTRKEFYDYVLGKKDYSGFCGPNMSTDYLNDSYNNNYLKGPHNILLILSQDENHETVLHSVITFKILKNVTNNGLRVQPYLYIDAFCSNQMHTVDNGGGYFLMWALLNACKRMGITQIKLDALDTAIDWYKNMGFNVDSPDIGGLYPSTRIVTPGSPIRDPRNPPAAAAAALPQLPPPAAASPRTPPAAPSPRTPPAAPSPRTPPAAASPNAHAAAPPSPREQAINNNNDIELFEILTNPEYQAFLSDLSAEQKRENLEAIQSDPDTMAFLHSLKDDNNNNFQIFVNNTLQINPDTMDYLNGLIHNNNTNMVVTKNVDDLFNDPDMQSFIQQLELDTALENFTNDPDVQEFMTLLPPRLQDRGNRSPRNRSPRNRSPRNRSPRNRSPRNRSPERENIITGRDRSRSPSPRRGGGNKSKRIKKSKIQKTLKK